MNSYRRSRMLTAGVAVAAWIGLAIAARSVAVWVVLGLTAACAGWWIYSVRREMRRRIEAACVTERERLYRLMLDWSQFERHDRMNEVQVLLGYLRLDKTDKLQSYVENIRARLARESDIAKLGVPELVVFLQTFGVMCRHIRLEVRMETEIRLDRLPIDSERAANALMAAVRTFAEAACADDGDPIGLTVELSTEDGALIASLDMHGRYRREALERRISESVRPFLGGGDMDYRDGEDWAAADIRLSFEPGTERREPDQQRIPEE